MSTSVGEVGVEVRRRSLSVKRKQKRAGSFGIGIRRGFSASVARRDRGLDAPFRDSVPHFFQGKRPRIPSGAGRVRGGGPLPKLLAGQSGLQPTHSKTRTTLVSCSPCFGLGCRVWASIDR